MKNLNTLKDKVIIISGTTQGIGASMIKTFADEGAIVIGCGRQAEKGQKVVDEILAAGGRAEFVPCSIIEEEQVKSLVNHVMEKYGRIDGLVNNAAAFGPYGNIPSVDLTAEQMRAPFETCVVGTFLMTKYVAAEMLKVGYGRIVDILSIHGFRCSLDMTPYHVAKAALFMLMKQDALNYGRHGVLVNAVAPGSIIADDSWPGYAKYLNVETIEEAQAIQKERLKYNNTMGCYGNPDDISAATRFFLCEGNFCSGAVINADGGAYIKGPN